MTACRPSSIDFDIAASAGWYSAIAGLLAGFALLYILFPLDHETTVSDETDTGNAVVVFTCAFFSLLILAFTYAVLAGRTGDGHHRSSLRGRARPRRGSISSAEATFGSRLGRQGRPRLHRGRDRMGRDRASSLAGFGRHQRPVRASGVDSDGHSHGEGRRSIVARSLTWRCPESRRRGPRSPRSSGSGILLSGPQPLTPKYTKEQIGNIRR